MKFTIFLLTFMCFSQLNFFALGGIVRSRPNPLRKPGGCYDEKIGHLNGGEQKTIQDQCVRAFCLYDGAIEYASCGKVAVAKNTPCTISAPDFTKPYPECCPRPVCKE